MTPDKLNSLPSILKSYWVLYDSLTETATTEIKDFLYPDTVNKTFTNKSKEITVTDIVIENTRHNEFVLSRIYLVYSSPELESKYQMELHDFLAGDFV